MKSQRQVVSSVSARFATAIRTITPVYPEQPVNARDVAATIWLNRACWLIVDRLVGGDFPDQTAIVFHHPAWQVASEKDRRFESTGSESLRTQDA